MLANAKEKKQLSAETMCESLSFVFQILKALSLHPPFPEYVRGGPAHSLIEQFRRVPSTCKWVYLSPATRGTAFAHLCNSPVMVGPFPKRPFSCP